MTYDENIIESSEDLWLPPEGFPTAGLDFEGKRHHYRRLFPVLEQVTYLDHAAIGPMSIPCVEAMESLMKSFSEGPMRPWTEWEAVRQYNRELMAKFLCADIDEIAFNFNTSVSLLLMSNCIAWQPGDNLIVPDREFPSVVMPAKLLEQDGVEARIVEPVDGLTSVDALLGAIDSRTKMMMVSMVNFLTGQRLDIKRLAKGCRDAGVILVVDAIQAAGPIKINVKDLGCHALTFGNPKWMFGPMGIGILYVDKDLICDLRIPQAGMFSVPEPWNFFNYEQPFVCTAIRYESGTQNHFGHHGYVKNLEMFLDLGPAKIEKYLLDFTGRIHDELTRRGVKVITPRADKDRAAIVTFDAASAGWPDAQVLWETLDKAHVTVSTRMGLIRLSPHFYNNWKEVERFLEVTFKEQVESGRCRCRCRCRIYYIIFWTLSFERTYMIKGLVLAGYQGKPPFSVFRQMLPLPVAVGISFVFLLMSFPGMG